MSFPSNYKTALVTGASRGIGAAIARTLAEAGLIVHAMARSEASLQDVALIPNIRPLVGDITRPDTLPPLLEGLDIDVLVNNAGAVGSVKPITEQSLRETTNVVTLNLIAPLHMMQLLVPGMERRGYGHVISVSSTAGHAVFPGTATYGASKAGLSQAHQTMRFDFAGKNVRFTEIIPGRVATDFYLQAFGGDEKKLKSTLYEKQRTLLPEDIAAAVLTALEMPERADISVLEISPTDQAVGGHVMPDHVHTQK